MRQIGCDLCGRFTHQITRRAEVENLRAIQGWNAALTDLQVLRGTFAGEIRVN